MSFPDDDNQATGITVISENDIVCGRGGAALKHPGNLAYRKIVNINKTLYATCLKAEKLRISKSIVAAIREVNGRFLEREDGKISTTLDERNPDGSPVTWCDIGDRRAIEKTSQALREGQPKLLKKLQAGAEQSPVAAGANGASYNMPIGAQPPLSSLPQVNVPMEDQTNYQYDQRYAYGQSLQSPSGNYAGTNPDHLKQDSFQMMIGETKHSVNTFVGNADPFPEHTSMSQQQFYPHHSVQDTWQTDPTPLPWHSDSGITMGNDESQQLLRCLDLERTTRSSVNSSSCIGSSQSGYGSNQDAAKARLSVTFKRGIGRDSLMSLGSHFSELSNWDTQSLDSAMDIAEREVDLKLLGNEELNFDWGDTYYEKNFPAGDYQVNQATNEAHLQGEAPRRDSACYAQGKRHSILRRCSRFSRYPQHAFPPAALNETADPGMLFTSTFDTKPGGVNAGTDVSGLIGERRKSAVAFEIKGDQQRRMSNIRLSNMSMFAADIGAMFRRDTGSTMSIQSADIREIIDMNDSDDD